MPSLCTTDEDRDPTTGRCSDAASCWRCRLLDLQQAIRDMREAQRRYFRTRDKGDLMESKRKERAVDLLVDPLPSPVEPDKQGRLL